MDVNNLEDDHSLQKSKGSSFWAKIFWCIQKHKIKARPKRNISIKEVGHNDNGH